MASRSFTLDEFTGSDAQVQVTLTDVGTDTVEVKIEVVSGYIADTVGFFADFDGLTVNNNFTITPVDASPGPALIVDGTKGRGKLYLDDSGSTTDSSEDVDNNVNLNGGGDQREFDLAVQIGQGGIGQGDDYRSVTFNLTATGLDVSDFSKIGVRLQSVGEDREGSSKLELEIPPEPQPAQLGDFVWKDLNENGIQDSGEPGVAGVSVTLLDGANAVVDTTTTDAAGEYLFDNLTPGNYKVSFSAPTGFDFTSANQGGNDAVDSDADPLTGMTQVVTLAAGESNLTLDAGLVETESPCGCGSYPDDLVNIANTNLTFIEYVEIIKNFYVESSVEGISALAEADASAYGNDVFAEALSFVFTSEGFASASATSTSITL